MNGRHWACRVELAFFLPEDVEAVFLLPGEFFHARIDTGLMLGVVPIQEPPLFALSLEFRFEDLQLDDGSVSALGVAGGAV